MCLNIDIKRRFKALISPLDLFLKQSKQVHSQFDLTQLLNVDTNIFF